MKKLDNFPKRGYTSSMTESFRNRAEETLGELDVAKTFMYLFLRFGAPNQSTPDPGKIGLVNFKRK